MIDMTDYKIDYQDKEGNKISLDEYASLFKQKDYQIIKHDHVNGKLVSTVWLGIPHMGSLGFNYYYETMVFNNQGLNDEDEYMERYRTLEEAKEGHQVILKKVKDEVSE